MEESFMFLFHSGVSTSARAPESCRCRWRPVRGTLPATTACLPEIRSAAGTGRCAWKYPHVHRGEGTHTRTLNYQSDSQCFLSGRTRSRFLLKRIGLLCFTVDPESLPLLSVCSACLSLSFPPETPWNSLSAAAICIWFTAIGMIKTRIFSFRCCAQCETRENMCHVLHALDETVQVSGELLSHQHSLPLFTWAVLKDRPDEMSRSDTVYVFVLPDLLRCLFPPGLDNNNSV